MKKGDILGITGLLGSGRGEIGETIYGITPPTSGKIIYDGTQIEIKNVGDAIRNGIGYVPEDRLTQGLFLEQSIGMNTVIAAIRNYRDRMALNYRRMRKSMLGWIDHLHIAAPAPDPMVKTLSGGNQQKVVLAKSLDSKPKILILNGPTVGVDVGSKADIHKILRQLAREGICVIIISDDLPELEQNCNSIIIMNHGKMAGTLTSEDFPKLSDILREC